MKKIFLLFVTAATIILAACRNTKAPVAVQQSFTKQFPGASSVKWEKEEGKYEASFTLNKLEMSAVFEENGTLADSETEIPVADLPGTIKIYVNTHYNGAVIKEAAKIILADGSLQFEAAIKGKDIIFNGAGSFVKEIED